MFVATKEIVIGDVTYQLGAEVPAKLVTKRMVELGIVVVKEDEVEKQVEEVILEDSVETLEEQEQLLIDDSSNVVVDED